MRVCHRNPGFRAKHHAGEKFTVVIDAERFVPGAGLLDQFAGSEPLMDGDHARLAICTPELRQEIGAATLRGPRGFET